VAPNIRYNETRAGDGVEVAVVGEIVWATTGSLIAVVERVIGQGIAHLVLNLGGVPFMDSTGLAAL